MNNMIEFTKGQLFFLKYVSLMKIFSIYVAVIGLLGISLNLFLLFSGTIHPVKQRLTISVVLYCVGLFLMGYLLYQAFVLIEKLHKTS